MSDKINIELTREELKIIKSLLKTINTEVVNYEYKNSIECIIDNITASIIRFAFKKTKNEIEEPKKCVSHDDIARRYDSKGDRIENKVEGIDELKMILHAKTVNLLDWGNNCTSEFFRLKDEIEFIQGVIETLKK